MSCDPNLHPRWPPSTDSFNMGPYGENVLKKNPLKPVSQFKANMA
jgi:hypothetical protein